MNTLRAPTLRCLLRRTLKDNASAIPPKWVQQLATLGIKLVQFQPSVIANVAEAAASPRRMPRFPPGAELDHTKTRNHHLPDLNGSRDLTRQATLDAVIAVCRLRGRVQTWRSDIQIEFLSLVQLHQS